MSGEWVELGRLGSPFGVRGWLHLQSFTDPPTKILEYTVWRLTRTDGSRCETKLLESRPQGRGFVARLEGVATREVAEALVGATIAVPRAELPELGEREHYRADLVGFEVRNVAGHALGRLAYFVDTGANAVMVIEGEREHLVPVTREHVQRIDRDARLVVVDWPEDF